MKNKIVIFDLNGIFIKAPYLSNRFKEEFGVEAGDFMPALKIIMDEARKPNAGNSYVFWKPYLEKWGVNLSEKEFFDFWFSGEKENEEMIVLARELKKNNFRLFILSNNFLERASYYKKNFKFLEELFEKIYYSFETGLIKPDAEVYKNFLKENNLKAGDCYYFDDSQKNIDVASSLGINSFVFVGPGQIKNILK